MMAVYFLTKIGRPNAAPLFLPLSTRPRDSGPLYPPPGCFYGSSFNGRMMTLLPLFFSPPEYTSPPPPPPPPPHQTPPVLGCPPLPFLGTAWVFSSESRRTFFLPPLACPRQAGNEAFSPFPLGLLYDPSLCVGRWISPSSGQELLFFPRPFRLNASHATQALDVFSYHSGRASPSSQKRDSFRVSLLISPLSRLSLL